MKNKQIILKVYSKETIHDCVLLLWSYNIIEIEYRIKCKKIYNR